jgi:hypothetical protein
MAYSFASASSQSLQISDNSVFDFTTEFSISFWSKNVSSTFSSYMAFFSKGDFNSTAPYLFYQVNDSVRLLRVMFQRGLTGYVFTDTPALSDWGTSWTHCAICYNGSGANTAEKVQVYKNGTSLTLTSATIPSTLSNTAGDLFIGNSSGLSYLNGSMSNVAMWDKQLNESEAQSLAKGFNPARIRPQSLVFNLPMIRNLQDIRNGLTITNNNSATVADHPRIYG